MALDIASAILPPIPFAWPMLASVGVLDDMSSLSSLALLLTVRNGFVKPRSCSAWHSQWNTGGLQLVITHLVCSFRCCWMARRQVVVRVHGDLAQILGDSCGPGSSSGG